MDYGLKKFVGINFLNSIPDLCCTKIVNEKAIFSYYWHVKFRAKIYCYKAPSTYAI